MMMMLHIIVSEGVCMAKKKVVEKARTRHTKYLKPSMWDIGDKYHFRGNDLYVTVRIPVEAIMRRVQIEPQGRGYAVRFNRRMIGRIGEF
jgi:hypothetical protein